MTFDDIYIEYYQRCFLFAKSYLHDEMQSKDIASEAMITLWSTMKTEEVKISVLFDDCGKESGLKLPAK